MAIEGVNSTATELKSDGDPSEIWDTDLAISVSLAWAHSDSSKGEGWVCESVEYPRKERTGPRRRNSRY